MSDGLGLFSSQNPKCGLDTVLVDPYLGLDVVVGGSPDIVEHF